MCFPPKNYKKEKGRDGWTHIFVKVEKKRVFEIVFGGRE